MYCNACGATVSEGNRFCPNCGAPLQAAPADSAPAQSAAVAAPQQPHTDGKAVASLILGIFSLTLFSFLAGIPAVILGHMSRSNIRKSMGRLSGEGMALAGLIMGYVSFLAIPIILIIAAIAIPNLLRARMAANEDSAVDSIRTINVAAAAYQSQHPKVGYPSRLADLQSSEAIDANLAHGLKNGYRFHYEATDSDGDGVLDHYVVDATPVKANNTGVRSFCSDETGAIHAERDGPCTSRSAQLD